MLWVRRFFVFVFSSVFLLSLLLLALAFSLNNSLGKPQRIETWLAQSNLYGNFIDNAISQSEKTVNQDNSNDGSVSFNNPAVQAAAKKAFSSDLIQQDVNTVIDANYDWLNGKTSTPTFTIDLSAPKKQFAQNVGTYVTTYLNGLPKCTPAELQKLSPGIDPLQLTCLPPNVNPTAMGQQVQQQIANSGDFLGNTVITANNINPDGHNVPYYTKLAHLPHAYRLAKKVPYVLLVIAVVSAVLIVVLSSLRRKGVRRVGVVLIEAGVLLAIGKFVADFAVNELESRAFNTANVGSLQQSLSDFAHRAESGLVTMTFWFGVAYVALGVLLLILIFSRNTQRRQPAPKQSMPAREENSELPETPAPGAEATDTPRAVAPGPPPLKPMKPGQGPKKKPKLVQL